MRGRPEPPACGPARLQLRAASGDSESLAPPGPSGDSESEACALCPPTIPIASGCPGRDAHPADPAAAAAAAAASSTVVAAVAIEQRRQWRRGSGGGAAFDAAV